MGFDVGQRKYVLMFEDSNMEGAEVHIKGTPLGVMLEIADPESDVRMLELLCEYVTWWNLEKDGEVVKLTPDDVKSNVEPVYLHKIFTEWERAARGITAPLDPPSQDGDQSEPPLIPMEVLDESLLS